MEEAVKLIRSILITSTDGLLYHEINSEYRDMVGEQIPFKKFGFNSLEEFLRTSGQFMPKKTEAGIRVLPKITNSSAHIIEMRRGQNVSAGDRKRRKKMAATNTRANMKSIPKLKGRNDLSTVTKGTSTTKQIVGFRNNSRNQTPIFRYNQPAKPLVQRSYPQPDPRRPLVQMSSNQTLNTQLSYQQNTKPVETVKPTYGIRLPAVNVRPSNENQSNENMKSTTVSAKSSLKIDLYARFPPKQTVFEPTTPEENPPANKLFRISYTPPTTPAKKPLKLNLSSRLVPKQSEIDLKMPELELNSLSHTPTDTPKNPSQKPSFCAYLSGVNLPARLHMIQSPVEDGHVDDESIPSANLSFSRAAFMKMMEKRNGEQRSKPKPRGRSVTFKPFPEVIDLNENDKNLPKLVCNFPKKLQSKKNSEIEELSEKVIFN